MSEPPDEFDWIAALRPLALGQDAALGLMDDAAVLPSRPGFDLVISEDAMVEGVHFLTGENAGVVARRLLRTSLSDLAAKGAEPFGYTLMTAWPANRPWADRLAFIEGLADDGRRYGVGLLGGDTVATPGPLTVSAGVYGWVPAGRAVLRSGARSGHALVVCGAIGDGLLGLKVARGTAPELDPALAERYRLPEPLLQLRAALLGMASAAADVSDGLIADCLHIGEASGRRVRLDLGRMPVSAAAAGWIAARDRTAALLDLAVGGDDYAIVCASPDGPALVREAGRCGVAAAIVGDFTDGTGLDLSIDGRPARALRRGWRHA